MVTAAVLLGGRSWIGSPGSANGHDVVQAPATTAITPIKALVATVLANRPLFGVTTADRSATTVDKIAAEVGCRPTLSQAFVSVAQGTSVQTLQKLGGVPLLTVEPCGIRTAA